VPVPARVDVVVTTIGGGEFIRPYADLLLRTGAADLARLVVIPDRRTPRGLYAAADAARRRGVRVLTPTVAEQERLLAKLGAPELIPWNSDNRRNVGYLLAWMSDAEYVVSIDDDNLPVADDMLERHGLVLAGPTRQQIVSCDCGWFNPCRMLDLDPAGVTAFARGFPYARRAREATTTTSSAETVVRVNAGLWFGDPDVDAVTRLALQPQASPAPLDPVVLDRATWAPVNSQNTALHREALPAYWFVRMGQRLFDGRVDRFGDIFSGYFLQACAKHLGHGVRFGDPPTRHLRNDHVVLEDLALELPGIRALEQLAEWLRERRLHGSDYGEAYRSLSHALDEAAADREIVGAEPRLAEFLHETAAAMRQWLDLLNRALA
jgi:hypothetical protein